MPGSSPAPGARLGLAAISQWVIMNIDTTCYYQHYYIVPVINHPCATGVYATHQMMIIPPASIGAQWSSPITLALLQYFVTRQPAILTTASPDNHPTTYDSQILHTDSAGAT